MKSRKIRGSPIYISINDPRQSSAIMYMNYIHIFKMADD